MSDRQFINGSCFALGMLALAIQVARLQAADDRKRLDPAAWGSDHVGQPVPEYATGDQCLFCHRDKIGPAWGANRHNLTIRLAEEPSQALAALKQSPAKALGAEVKYILGHQRRQRFLKPATAYGQLELLSVAWLPPQVGKPEELLDLERPHWHATRFADGCAGCHTTAVDPRDKAFAAISLDCYVCHGNIPTEHARKPELAYLSPRRKEDARVVISICAQCHVRTGKSKETGRPYPTNFVPGDNLFRDFQVDISDQALQAVSLADRHVLENVRDVVVFGQEAVTCLSCHDIHGRSSRKHHRVAEGEHCLTCHTANGPKREPRPLSVFSKTCGY